MALEANLNPRRQRMTPEETYINRRRNLKTILAYFPSNKEFAKSSGISAAQVSQLNSGNDKYRIGGDMARRIEKEGAKPMGWLDQDHSIVVDDIDDIDLIVRTCRIVNETLLKFDMPPHKMKPESYEEILKSSIEASVTLGLVTTEQIQHTLLVGHISKTAL